MQVLVGDRGGFRLEYGKPTRAPCGCVFLGSYLGMQHTPCAFHRFHPFANIPTSTAGGKEARRWARAHRAAIRGGVLKPRRMRIRFTVDGKPGLEV